MGKSFSIAEAKDQLSKLVHDAEGGAPVELTRRGQPVAVLMSIGDYRRLSADKGAFWERLEGFRIERDVANLGIEPDEWLGGIRDASQARDFGCRELSAAHDVRPVREREPDPDGVRAKAFGELRTESPGRAR